MLRNTFKNFSLLLILILGLLTIGLPLINIEATNVPPATEIENPLGADSFTELFLSIADWIAGIAATVAVLMVIIGGIQYMVSGGSEEKVAVARKTIQWSLIGLMIILASWGLLQALLEILGITIT